ncbi:MarR family transcriptional regulator [Streptomyces lavendulae]|uniref:MarR family winged helix-turn-helix transcriptional regulator n=1 Tax=Streptomyces lavendulae TaxID=1914 RepID=UPI0033EE6825
MAVRPLRPAYVRVTGAATGAAERTVPPLVHREPGAAAAPTRPPAGFWCPRTAVAAARGAAVFAGKESGTLQCRAELVRCETRLYNAPNDRLRGRHGIVTSQFEFLRFLRDHPGARVADLAAEFAIGIGATGKDIDRLEKQAWVRRRFDPSDRRSSLPDLTDDGRQPVETAEATFTETPAELTADNPRRPLGTGRRADPLGAPLRVRTRPDRPACRLTACASSRLLPGLRGIGRDRLPLPREPAVGSVRALPVWPGAPWLPGASRRLRCRRPGNCADRQPVLRGTHAVPICFFLGLSLPDPLRPAGVAELS